MSAQADLLALATGPRGRRVLEAFLALVEDREIRSRPDVERLAAALCDAKGRAMVLALDGGGIDRRRRELEAEFRSYAERRKLRKLLRALLDLHFIEDHAERGVRPEWQLRSSSAQQAQQLVQALLADYPGLMIEYRSLAGAYGRLGLPPAPLLRRDRRGDPLAGVKRAADSALADARVPRAWRQKLLAAVGVK